MSRTEVKSAMKRMKKSKAVGPDDIPVEAWECLGDEGIDWLTNLFNSILTSEEMPEEWRASTLVPIFKNKGDIQECKNYRGIKLMSHTMKMWERVIEKRLREEVTISDEQFGFMPGRSTMDAIFALRQLMEKYREGRQKLHCVFIDLEKAYDRVPRAEVWNCMRLKKVSEKYIRVVQDMYKNSSTQVRTSAGVSESFEVSVGVHQGSALSPFLFTVIMDCMSEEFRKEAPWNMMFADDVVICAPELEEAEKQLEEWRKALEDRGMRVSRQKTEHLYFGGEDAEPARIKMQEEEVPRVQVFKYLGSTVQEDGGAEREVASRISAGWNSWRKVSGVLCDKKIPPKVKGKIHNTIVRPAMLYGLETVALTKCLLKKLEVTEMKMLRWSKGVTLLDKVQNEDVRRAMAVGDLSVKLREGRLRWFGHVWRRDDQYVGKKVWNLRVGTRGRGRPRIRWKDCVEEDMREQGVQPRDAEERLEWRRKIRTRNPD